MLGLDRVGPSCLSQKKERNGRDHVVHTGGTPETSQTGRSRLFLYLCRSGGQRATFPVTTAPESCNKARGKFVGAVQSGRPEELTRLYLFT